MIGYGLERSVIKMTDNDCQRAVQEYIYALEDIIEELKDIRTQVLACHRKCMAGKTVGLSVGAAGSAVSVIGFLGAPLTGGLSLAATVSGMTSGLAGATASTVSEFSDAFLRK